MKKKNSKTKNSSTNSKSGHYNLRNKTISSEEKKNLEKMFSQMKKEIFDEIYATTENIFNEHKDKIINTIIESQNNEDTPISENVKENKTSKTQKSKKKSKDNNISKESIDKNEIENENKVIDSPPKKTKSKKSHFSKKKKKIKNIKKENSLANANGEEKTDATSLNNIPKPNDTDSKVEKEKNGNEEIPLNNSLVGKKRKRGINNSFDKSEVNNDKKKSKSKKK